MKIRLLTVTNKTYEIGTVAAVNSLIHHHRDNPDVYLDIHIVHMNGGRSEWSGPFHRGYIKVHAAEDFLSGERQAGAWQMKSYAACDLMHKDDEYDVFLGFDSDLFFCQDILDIAALCKSEECIFGGKDGDRKPASKDYEAYPNIKEGDSMNPYFSSSCYFLPRCDWSLQLVSDVAERTNSSFYGSGQSIYPGYGDQGVLNASVMSAGLLEKVKTLPNRLWSQHWTGWKDTMTFHQGCLYNHTQDAPQRTCHSTGHTPKFWTTSYRESIHRTEGDKLAVYTSFLGYLFCLDYIGLGDIPNGMLPQAIDTIRYFSCIREVLPEAELRFKFINKTLNRSGVHRLMPPKSMETYMSLVAKAGHGTVVEVGSYHGGSLLTIACLFADRRDMNFVSVESFSGDLNGKVDNLKLPVLGNYLANFNRYGTLPISSLPLPSRLAAKHFNDKSLSLVMVDAAHDTDSVVDDIKIWREKVRDGGILAGDDFGWDTVRRAVELSFPASQIKHEGAIWWIEF